MYMTSANGKKRAIEIALVIIMAGLVLYVGVLIGAPEISTVATDGLSRDAAYTGSMTLAGLAMFGSVMGARIGNITTSTTFARRIATAMVVLGPLCLACLHMFFAYMMCCNEPKLLLDVIVYWSIIFVFISAYGFVHLITSRQ